MIVDFYDFCDYCGASGPPLRVRIVGTIPEGEELGGLPLVKTWCGMCPVPDDIDPDASRAFANKLLKKEES